MKRLAEDARTIAEAFDILLDACENIKSYERCDECPMRYMCLDATDESVVSIADLMSDLSWREFLEYSAKADFSDADYDAQHADFMRKYEIEERGLD